MTFGFGFIILLDVTKFSRQLHQSSTLLRRHVYTAVHERLGEKLLEWLRSNGKSFKVERCGKKYAMK